MNRYVKGQTYGQRIKVLVDLLRLYGKLAPGTAAMNLKCMTERLAADIRTDHSVDAMNVVGR